MSETKTSKPLSENILSLATQLEANFQTEVNGQVGTAKFAEVDINEIAIKQINPDYTTQVYEDVDTARTNTIAAHAEVLRREGVKAFKGNPDLQNIGTGKLGLGGSTTFSMNLERSHTYPAMEGKDGKPGREAVEKHGVLSVDHTFKGARAGIGSLNRIRAQMNEEFAAALR